MSHFTYKQKAIYVVLCDNPGCKKQLKKCLEYYNTHNAIFCVPLSPYHLYTRTYNIIHISHTIKAYLFYTNHLKIEGDFWFFILPVIFFKAFRTLHLCICIKHKIR